MLQKNEHVDPEAAIERLRRFVEILVQWNRSVSNLISKNDEERIVASHVLPSIETFSWLKSHDFKHWCDLGSGGGFPALPLAICGLGESWDLVESRRTKTLFLMRAVSELKLTGVRVLTARIEDLIARVGSSSNGGAGGVAGAGGGEAGTAGDAAAGESWGDESSNSIDDAGAELRDDSDEGARDEPMLRLSPPYDGFTSRATLSLAPTLEYAARIVRPGGGAFLWKGSRLADEAEQSTAWRENWESGESKVLSIAYSVVANFKRSSK